MDHDEKTIRKHINNTFKDQEVEKENNTQKMRVVGVKQSVPSILHDYTIKGYAVNQKRLDVLNKTVAIQSRMLASALNIEEKEVLNVIEAYSNALTLLDDYDHGTIPKPDGIASVYQLTYEECREMIDSMKYGNDSDVFGVEKELGKLNGISAAYIKMFLKLNCIQVLKKRLQTFFTF